MQKQSSSIFERSYGEMIVRILLLTLLIFIHGCKSGPSEKDVLLDVSDNLSSIKSATYYLTGVGSAPGDTTKFSEPRTMYYKIFVNPSDTLVGSSSAIFSIDDTSKMIDFYDGEVRGKCYWDEQYVKVDSFQNHPYPFRLVHYPFYTRINEIIKYSLTTEDSIQTGFTDYGDSIHFSLSIFNKHVYFHIKPIVIENDYIPEDEVSQFDIWIRKSDSMPYRMRSKWHHTTSFEFCYNATFNTTEDIDFIAKDYFPSYFEIVQFKREQQKPKKTLLGKLAPDWTLKDIDHNNISLSDIKSKVLLIQFTGVGCGPCHQSIPFLKQLVEDYKGKDFEFISIETWSNNIDGLRRYQERNEFNFKFLKSDEEVTQQYEVYSVPVFFLLDENRIIRKVINGYSKDETDKSICDNIDNLL
jgi:peroxiredoxin